MVCSVYSVRSVVKLLQLRKKNKIMTDISKPVRIMDIRGTYKGGGGPDKTVLQSALLHDKKRIHILVTYLRDPKDKEFQITEMAQKLKINYVEVLDRKVLDIKCLYKLYQLIIDHRLEVYHAHDDKTLLYGWLLKIIRPSLKIIYTCHGNFPPQITHRNFLRHYFSLFLKNRYLKPIMAVSEFCRTKLVSYGIKKEDIITLHNGINLDKWHLDSGSPVLKKELGLNSNELLVGTVARIDPQKDLETFLKVAKRVVACVENARFVIVGDGKDKELSDLKKNINDLGLYKVVYLTGHRNDIYNVYASFDLFLMTSIMEGLPNTVLEAMSMETPVVSTAVSGVPEVIVDNQTGYLCDIGDDKALAERVITILTDNKLRDQFGRESRKHIVENFSFKDRVQKLEDAYEFFGRLD